MISRSAMPEEAGFSSRALLNFLEHLEERKICMHNIMILRHGKIIFEAHYPPYTIDTFHRMYSVTKTFVSIAIGFMIDEGKISLSSKLCDFFSEFLPETVNPFTAEMNVRDLLLMANTSSMVTIQIHFTS